MNALLAAAVLLPPVIIGVLVVHLSWDDRRPTALFLKLFLGIGIGLGTNSLLYFLYLLAFAGQHFFVVVQVAFLIFLALVTIRHESAGRGTPHAGARLDSWMIGLLAAALVVAAFAVDGALTVWGHRPSGTWDAFMIYNRTARFVFRGQADWLQSFSSQLDPVFHADYPLLIPLTVASSWDTLGRESLYVPLFFSAAFILACSGLLASALALVKSPWQAAAGLIILLNTPLFLITGASQTADVPLSYFILATAVLIFIYSSLQQPGLIAMAGLTVGLAAWTKNEGQLFVAVASVCVPFIVARSRRWRDLGAYLGGLLPALAIVAYFKLFVAPPNDLLAGSLVQSLQSILQPSRHLTILGQYFLQIASFGQSWIWVGLVPLAYGLVFGFSPAAGTRRVYWLLLLLVVLQLIGYYLVYLITPHPISWQLESSLDRLLLQMYPLVLFIWFILVTDVAAVLGRPASAEAASIS